MVMNGESCLEGQLLIAMPSMNDPRFERAVIYICVHTPSGAMGVVINRLADNVSFVELLNQLDIETSRDGAAIRVHLGGPVETSRGLVLHSADYTQDATIMVGDNVALTASIDILRKLAVGSGPQNGLLALGYAGWGPGQLEQEIRSNGWLHVPADDQLLFDHHLDSKWDRALSKIGFDVSMLSVEAGNA